LFDFEGTDHLTFARHVNGVSLDTLHFVKELTIFDSLEFEVGNNPGEINKIIHTERAYYSYIDDSTGETFEVQIWANAPGGIIDAYMYFKCADLFFVGHLGETSFAIGDKQSIGYQSKANLNGNTFKDVWNMFHVYGDLKVAIDGYNNGSKAGNSDLWYSPNDGPVGIKINDKEFWYKIDY
jgi:hypothetical protein